MRVIAMFSNFVGHVVNSDNSVEKGNEYEKKQT